MVQSKTRKSIQLLVVKKNQKIKYFKKCKVTVNKITEELIIKPKNTAQDNFYITNFNQNYVKIKNLLCIFKLAATENNYILILPNEEKCTKVYESIQAEKPNGYSEIEIYKQLFLSLFNEIQDNSTLKKSLKDIANILIASFSSDNLIKWLKEENIELKLFNKLFDGKLEELADVKQINEKSARSRKRSAISRNIVKAEIEEKNEDKSGPPAKQSKLEDVNEIFKQNIASNNFEVIKYEDRGKPKTTLIVFTSAKKLQCFEYYWDNHLKLFKCCGCKAKAKDVRAAIVKRNGKEFIKPNQKPHVCELRDFNKEKYIFDAEKQIVKAPNFEFVSYVRNGSSRKKLIVFYDSIKQKCYEYIYEKLRNVYLCAGCRAMQVFSFFYKIFACMALQKASSGSQCRIFNALNYVKQKNKN